MNGEARANPGPARCTSIVNPATAPDKPSITIERSRLARWLEMVDAAIDNPDECVDVLIDLASSLEDVFRRGRAS
jgi:hypothetical protein